MRISFIGSVGVPNRYGGFESFLEACAPVLAQSHAVTVTCEAAKYSDRSAQWRGVNRIFLPIRANGPASVLHDCVAFLRVLRKSDVIVVLGVSAGLAFPFMRALCSIFGKKLLVNVDGLEWRRIKFSPGRRLFLRLSDAIAQAFSHKAVVDSAALLPYLTGRGRRKAVCIPYSGDQVPPPQHPMEPDRALTICRIEPENNCHLLLEAVRASRSNLHYEFIGNWDASEYGRELKRRYQSDPRFSLLPPVYDAAAIAGYRARAGIYLHGHSVGGTNPSLVEILFYDAEILAFDCPFNREVAQDAARYFTSASSLTSLLDSGLRTTADRRVIRELYTRANVVRAYLEAMEDT